MKNFADMLAWTMIVLKATTIQSFAQSTYEPYTFTTLAGSAASGSADVYYPFGVAVDSAGNVYVSDIGNYTIRKVTPAGVVTTLAGLAGSVGSADGTGSAAQFRGPAGVAVDSAGNVYVADGGNNTIRKVTPAGVVTTLAGLAQCCDRFGLSIGGSADGTGNAARFNYPASVAIDSADNLYVADHSNFTIRKVTPAGVVTTLAGLAGRQASVDGTGSAARFYGPYGVAVDSAGNVYVADFNNTIRKVTPAGMVTTLAGRAQFDGIGNPVGGSVDGTGSAARFYHPIGVAVDSAGDVYVADQYNSTIRKVTPAGVVTTLAGLAQCCDRFGLPVGGSADGAGSDAGFNYPAGVAVDNAGNVYVADTSNNAIRKMTPARVVTTLAGLAGSFLSADGTGSAARFNQPYGVAVDSAANVYVVDARNLIRKVTPAGVVTTLAGRAGTLGSADGKGSDARFNDPFGVAVDSAGNVYVADTGNNTIRKVTPAGVVTTLAGLAGAQGGADGTGSAARFYYPYGVAVDSAGNVYVADQLNQTIRKVTPAGVVTTLAGQGQCCDGLGHPVGGSADGTGNAARFNYPSGVAVDSAGTVYVADTRNYTIRKVTPAGVVTTLAGNASITNHIGGPVGGYADGTGSRAEFSQPFGVAVDSAGNVYVADPGSATIRKVTPTGVVTTLAGLAGSQGSADGTGSTVRFSGPFGVAVDSAGNVYGTDTGNNTIRKGYPAVMVVNSGPGFGFNGGKFGFRLAGPAAKLVIVEASIDLVSWLPLWTNTFAGALVFSDPQSSVYSHRFYRAFIP